MISRNLIWAVGPLSLSFVACSSDGTDSSDETGGPSTGSAVGAGGAGTGGSGASGGGSGSGGTATGGATPTGGSSSTGGATATGGHATGGAATGGMDAGGGASGGHGTGGESGNTGGSGGGGHVGSGPSDLPAAPGSDDVPRPSGTPGDITVIDWAGFPAAVTYSFDDNDGSQLDYYDQMHEIGGRYTFYLVTDGSLGVAINDPRWKMIFDDGNEIGNHTTNHSCGESQIDGANTAIENEFGKRSTTLAAPNGDDACQGQAAGRVFINREVGPSTPVTPLDNTDPFAMNCYIPATGQAASAYNANIDDALSQNGWVIYVIHGINPGTNHTFQPVSWDGLKGAIEYSKSNDVWIDTMENIGSYWLGQKLFADAMTETNGDTTTWTWTLPDNFPEGKYLRVTVEGGTLTQGGTPLTWDPHGYYEIALDEGSVTLAP